MKRTLTIGAVLLLIAVGASAWLLVSKPVRLRDDLAGPEAGQRATMPDMRLDLNAATADELTLLPGIGPALAEAIVSYRETHGRISSIDEMLGVPGIGEGRLQAIAPHVVVDPKD